ncbi:MAG TPA: septal ring lytic transglycosylase RlpA family protein [Stellaceae bacterium]|nr:septal ring lytic transglycosylase RlpA family protein [Stellaceae bacterium]
MAKQVHAGRDHAVPSTKSKTAKADTSATKTVSKTTGKTTAKTTAKRHHAHSKLARRLQHAGDADQHAARLPPPDQYLGPMKVVGQREIGAAAWYGGRHIGRRTASGERLDAVELTAAHRSLPLYSLVRVTNLTNGRSCVARINDRGPVSHSLLIDVSPGVADKLDMKRAGIVKVAVEPVAPAPSSPR